MTTHVIEKVTADKGAVDRIEWSIRFHVAPYGNRRRHIFVLGCEGQLVLYREAVPSSILPGSAHPRLSLSAQWVNRPAVSRVFAPEEKVLAFRTELPGDALERLERFRDGGRLFARFEGQLFYLEKEERAPQEQWLGDLIALLGDYGRSVSWDVRSEPFELTRDQWTQAILGTLRPPGRFILEVTVPVGTAHEQAAQDALAHLGEARHAFDEGRYPEVARTCYRALDELQKLAEQWEARYGKYGRDRLNDELKALKGLCNPERHASATHHDGLSFGRALAQHVLACTSSLVGLGLT